MRSTYFHLPIMESDEARKALGLAQKHDSNGNTESALKWARKSVSIYSTPEAVQLVTRLETHGASGKGTTTSTTTTTSETHEKSSSGNQESTRIQSSTRTESSGNGVEYTSAQVEIVRRVRQAGGDFYKILGLEKSAEEGAIRKSYKKVS